MKKIRLIENQKVIETDKHLIIKLNTPWWSAYQRYGWKDKIEGFGLSKKLVEIALDLQKKIIINYKIRYEITPTKILKLVNQYGSYFVARNGTTIVVIPRDACIKLTDNDEEQVGVIGSFSNMNMDSRKKMLESMRKALKKT